MKGEEPEVNDTTTYFMVSLSFRRICALVFADINNYKELLIDSGYYTPEQFDQRGPWHGGCSAPARPFNAWSSSRSSRVRLGVIYGIV